jgi:hypothetical protein
MTNPVYLATWATIGEQHATIGDHLAAAIATEALGAAGVPSLRIGVGEEPPNEAAKVWVCGPVDLSYLPQQRLIADGRGWVLANVTLVMDRSGTGDAVIDAARDGQGVRTRGDFACLAPRGAAGGFAAIMLRGHQPEYRQSREIHQAIGANVARAVTAAGFFGLPVNTSAPPGLDPFIAASGLERVLSASSVVITSRLHGVIHSLRSGRVPVVIDEIERGGKVTALAEEFELPILIPASSCTEGAIVGAIEKCRTLNGGDAERLLSRMAASARQNVALMTDIVIRQRLGPNVG